MVEGLKTGFPSAEAWDKAREAHRKSPEKRSLKVDKYEFEIVGDQIFFLERESWKSGKNATISIVRDEKGNKLCLKIGKTDEFELNDCQRRGRLLALDAISQPQQRERPEQEEMHTRFVMPFLGEKSLNDLSIELHQKHPPDPLKLKQFTRLVKEAAWVLHQEFHSQGRAHGDATLDNFLINSQGRVVLIDPLLIVRDEGEKMKPWIDKDMANMPSKEKEEYLQEKHLYLQEKQQHEKRALQQDINQDNANFSNIVSDLMESSDEMYTLITKYGAAANMVPELAKLHFQPESFNLQVKIQNKESREKPSSRAGNKMTVMKSTMTLSREIAQLRLSKPEDFSEQLKQLKTLVDTVTRQAKKLSRIGNTRQLCLKILSGLSKEIESLSIDAESQLAASKTAP